MPSPFPGMDPFIESQAWEDFHHAAIEVIREQIRSITGRRYSVWVERRIYVETVEPVDFRPSIKSVIPDAAVIRDDAGRGGIGVATAATTATSVECLLPIPEERRESYLVLRDTETRRIITTIELLSPSNKKSGGRGRRKYLMKRRAVIDSDAHLIEIDLLRGGAHMPLETRRPITDDYIVLVSRTDRRPKAELFPWSLPARMPIVPVPLANDDPDVTVDLQAVLDTVYDRAGYDRMLNYAAPLVPPADPDRQRWIDDLLASKGITRRTSADSEPLAENTAS